MDSAGNVVNGYQKGVYCEPAVIINEIEIIPLAPLPPGVDSLKLLKLHIEKLIGITFAVSNVPERTPTKSCAHGPNRR